VLRLEGASLDRLRYCGGAGAGMGKRMYEGPRGSPRIGMGLDSPLDGLGWDWDGVYTCIRIAPHAAAAGETFLVFLRIVS